MYLLRLENRVCNFFNQFFKKILCNLLILLFGPPQFIKGDPHRIYVETNSYHIWVWMTVINQIVEYIEYIPNRCTTVEEDLEGDTHLWLKEGTRGSSIKTEDFPHQGRFTNFTMRNSIKFKTQVSSSKPSLT